MYSAVCRKDFALRVVAFRQQLNAAIRTHHRQTDGTDPLNFRKLLKELIAGKDSAGVAGAHRLLNVALFLDLDRDDKPLKRGAKFRRLDRVHGIATGVVNRRAARIFVKTDGGQNLPELGCDIRDHPAITRKVNPWPRIRSFSRRLRTASSHTTPL